jgi:hypothetical protein
MHFGPLELQACGENNFTMKALGLLAFDRALRLRFVRRLLGEDAIVDGDDPTILFFSRIGEGFMREAIERERHGGTGDLEARLNRAAGLPQGFRWARKSDGRLVQAAKWQTRHVEEMLARNRVRDDGETQELLQSLQDDLNTEPDLVLQWADRLLLVEIKVLSGEGSDQLGRQRRLGEFLGALLGWTCSLRLIGPEGSAAPSDPTCAAVTWAEVAAWFDDVPAIAEYIRGFRFFYGGSWRSMVSHATSNSAPTAFDLMLARSPSVEAPAVPAQIAEVPSLELPPSALGATAPKGSSFFAQFAMRSPSSGGHPRDPRSDPWHFSHLGLDYFRPIALAHRGSRLPAIKRVWTGRTGVQYALKSQGRKVNPNWMVELIDGSTYTGRTGFMSTDSYDKSQMHAWSWSEIVESFGPML